MTICKNAKVNYWSADMDLESMKHMPYITGDDDDDDDGDGDNDDDLPSSSNGPVNDDDDNEQLDDILEHQRARLERKQTRFDEHLLKNPTKDDMVVFKRVNK
jgi:hypothetical protein